MAKSASWSSSPTTEVGRRQRVRSLQSALGNRSVLQTGEADAASLSGFLGYSANAIRWQVWTALLVYVLLRFAAHLSQWGHSFTRLFAVVRAALWERLDALGLLRSYGTAGG